jgi:hypothetical protein
MMKAWTLTDDAYAKAIADSEEGMRYLNNDPYTSDEKADALNHKKPLLRYNIIQPLFATLLGNEQQFRRRARVRAHEGGEQAAVANIIQGRWNAINDEQNVEEKLDTVMIDALTLEMGGAIERRFKVNSMGYLDFDYQVKNTMRVRYAPDTLNSDYALEKCPWILKEELLTIEELIARFGDRADFTEEKKTAWKDKFASFLKRFTDSEYSSKAHFNEENGKYRVVEMQKRVYNKTITYSDGEGIHTISSKEFRKLKGARKITEGTTEGIHITISVPHFNWLTVVDEAAKWPSANFDIFPMWSFEYNTQVIEGASLMGLLKDMQDDVNKGVSQNRDYVTQHLSGMLMTSTREKEANEIIDRKGNQPGQRVGLKDMKNNMPQVLAPAIIDPMSLGSTDHAEAYSHKVSSVTEQLQGTGGKSGESNVLFENKVAQAAASVNPHFKNRSKLRKALMADFVDNFSWVYAENMRVLDLKSSPTAAGIYSQEIINLNIAGEVFNDVSNPSMFVEIDEGEDNTLQREDHFNQLLALANVLSGIDPRLVPPKQLVDAAPIEGKDEWMQWLDVILGQQFEDAAVQRAGAETAQVIEGAQGAQQLEQPQGVTNA